MKKQILLTLLLQLAVHTVCAQTLPPPTDIPIIPSGPKPLTLSETPSIRASYTSDSLLVSITGYFGFLEVILENENTGSLLATHKIYVCWQGNAELDIHDLEFGSYAIRLRLENGEDYIGHFLIL